MIAPNDRTNMNRIPCGPANSILEADLELAAQHQIIDKLKVMETPSGFYVIAEFSDKSGVLEHHKETGLPEWFYIVAQILAEPGKEWYLTTRRDRTKPRLFKDLKRLNKLLKDAYPTDTVEIIRNQQVPGKGKAPRAVTKAPQTKEKVLNTKKGNL